MAEKNIYKQKRMIKNLIIAVAVLVVMIAAVVMVMNIPEKTAEEKLESSSDYVTLYKCDYEKINRITLENEKGTNVFVKEYDEWLCENAPEVEISGDDVLALAMNFGTIVGTLVEEEAQDLTAYGFDTPSAQVTIEFNDGASKQFILGNSTATGSGYYLKLADEPAVYILAQYRCSDFFLSLFDFRDSDVFTPESEETMSVTVTNKNGEFKINKFDAENASATALFMSNWQLVEPGTLEGKDESIEQILFSEMQLKTTDFIADDSSMYEQYGFNEPTCVASYKDIDGLVTTVTFGKMLEGKVFVKISGADWLYIVSASNLSILDADYLDVSSNLAMLEKIDNVKSVHLFYDNKNHIMSIDRSSDEESYKIGNLNVEEDVFKDLYQKIIGVTVEGEVENPGSGQHLCSVTFNYIDDLGSKTIDYYTYEDRFASIIINGELKFFTSRDKVQKIIDGVNEIIK